MIEQMKCTVVDSSALVVKSALARHYAIKKIYLSVVNAISLQL